MQQVGSRSAPRHGAVPHHEGEDVLMLAHWLRLLRRRPGQPTIVSRRRPEAASRRLGQLGLEALEDRWVPSTAPLVVASFFDSAVYKIDASTGAVLQTLVAPTSNFAPGKVASQ